jgi:hypothetical protein
MMRVAEQKEGVFLDEYGRIDTVASDIMWFESRDNQREAATY